MASPEVQGIDESKLFTEQAIALSILRNLTVEQLDTLKARLGLSHPGVIGPMTLDSFVAYFKDVGVDLTPAGVSAFKNAHNLTDTGVYQGVIGATTAAAYYESLTKKPVDPNKELLRVAASYIGVQEKGANKGKEVEMFQKAVDGKAVGEPWCMGFVQFCIKTTEAATGAKSSIFSSEHCMTVWDKSPSNLRLKQPEPGALVLWRKGSTTSGHVGIVESVQGGGSFTTIEGNTGGGTGVEREGDGVYRKKRTMGTMGSMSVEGFLRVF